VYRSAAVTTVTGLYPELRLIGELGHNSRALN
jgi:hypothetical protein